MIGPSVQERERCVGGVRAVGCLQPALRAGFSRPKRLADWLTTHRLHIHITETERERRRDDRVRQTDSEDR